MYSHEALEGCGGGMLLLVYHPGTATVVVASREAFVAANKQLCNSRVIMCTGPL
jgi:hypothetical protein